MDVSDQGLEFHLQVITSIHPAEHPLCLGSMNQFAIPQRVAAEMTTKNALEAFRCHWQTRQEALSRTAFRSPVATHLKFLQKAKWDSKQLYFAKTLDLHANETENADEEFPLEQKDAALSTVA